MKGMNDTSAPALLDGLIEMSAWDRYQAVSGVVLRVWETPSVLLGEMIPKAGPRSQPLHIAGRCEPAGWRNIGEAREPAPLDTIRVTDRDGTRPR